MKKMMKFSALALAVTLLAACAVTPAEKAAEAKAQAQQMLDTQVSLAAQCSPQAAELMKEMPNADQLTAAERKIFEAKYTNAIDNQVFQACYNMAWKGYREQNQMQAEQMAAWTDADDTMDSGMFFNGPFGFGGWGGWGY